MASSALHEPIPRAPDEFSYVLMGEMFTGGHISAPSPPLPEFFDTFHVLVHPVYASKYFPAQGLFLAVGQKLTGHEASGIWLSAALASAGVTWMLQAYLGPVWALLGGLLFVVQYGIFSYWHEGQASAFGLGGLAGGISASCGGACGTFSGIGVAPEVSILGTKNTKTVI